MSAQSVAAILIMVAVGAVAAADDAAADKADSPSIESYLHDLGDDNFARREAASQALLRLGEQARGPLVEHLKLADDAEVIARGQTLLAEWDRRRFERQLKQFLAGGKGEDLPGWKKFRAAVVVDPDGNDQSARDLYLDMLLAQPQLLYALRDTPEKASELFTAARKRVQDGRAPIDVKKVPKEQVAALLFAAAHDCVTLSRPDRYLLYIFCGHCEDFALSKNLQSRDELLRRVAGMWVASGRGGSHMLRVARRYLLPEGLIGAEKILRGEVETPAGDKAAVNKSFAIELLAKMGSVEHIPLLEAQLDDDHVRSRFGGKTTGTPDAPWTHTIEIRDMALAAILKIAGEDIHDYGFTTLYKNSDHWAGFANDQERAAALAKWKAFKKRRAH